MRLLPLLLMGIFPELALAQTVCRVNLLEIHPYDTLKKYSYLIVSMRRDELHHKRNVPLAVGTGFFVRKEKKLYLVSARHVFTNCDPYTAEPRGDTPVAVKVWYRDTLGRTTNQLLPLPGYKMLAPCKQAFVDPDIDVMDVSEYFKDGKINSVDYLTPDYHDYHPLSPCDTVITYGYSHEPGDKDTIERNPNLVPVGYISYSRDSIDDQVRYVKEQLSISYYAIEPGLPHGASGAPIFKVSSIGNNKTMVEFSGIQSSTRDDWKVSYIVRGNVLSNLFQLK